MRIGTWNLDARWDNRHLRLIGEQECDVWLLTEVPSRASVPRFVGHLTAGRMARQQHWAGVFAREASPAMEPDAATAAARTAHGLSIWSSVLPWPTCGAPSPWLGARHDDRVRHAVDGLRSNVPTGDLIWGGDWNHSLSGRVVGSRVGRIVVLELVEQLQLQVPTADLPHQLDGVRTVDHVAVPAEWEVVDRGRVPASSGGKWLSDHDLYVLDVNPS